MGKGGELWDDSALVDAFDHAVATYKAMHGKNKQAAQSQKQESVDVPASAVAVAAEEEPVSTDGADERLDKESSCTTLPVDQTVTLQQPCEENVNDTEKLDSSNRQTSDYNELLRKYYELEVQSREVLEQLHQTNYWNYQIPGQSSAYQQEQVPAYSATAPDPYTSTTQPSCCSLNVPMVSVSCCSTGQQSGDSTGGCSISLTCDQCPGASTTYPTGATFVQLPAKVSNNDDQVAKAAKLAAEGAMNFMRTTISGDPGSFPRNEGETRKENNTTVGMHPNFHATGADSDLTVVLNAWYTAGFYTGRYLMQQSMKNSREN
uniref:Uncharacterized protein n=1 Tax=Avena sativa TaxID=4498 RepID=A0ACD5ZKL0_AVESA